MAHYDFEFLGEIYDIIGKVYRVAPPLFNDNPSVIRIYDGSYGQAGSEIGYLYPRDYFEVLDLEA